MIVALAAAALAAAPALPACRPGQLALSLGGNPGDFNGMQHSGTLLVLHNTGRAACRLPALPMLRFLDARGRRLPTLRRAATARPATVTLSPRRPLATALRWVSGDAYGDGNCRTVGRIEVALPGGTVGQRLSARLCAPAAKPAEYEQKPLAPLG